jgi:hypothetical protein
MRMITRFQYRYMGWLLLLVPPRARLGEARLGAVPGGGAGRGRLEPTRARLRRPPCGGAGRGGGAGGGVPSDRCARAAHHQKGPLER